jgi:hypothetical protein
VVAKQFESRLRVTGQPGDMEAFVRNGLLWVNNQNAAKALVVDSDGVARHIDKHDTDVWNLSNKFSGGPGRTFGFGNSDYCWPVTGDWKGAGPSGIGVACHEGHELSWKVMYGPYGGTPQKTASFGNGDYYQPTSGHGGPSWPGWPSG